jgi:hypothetical protein
MSGHSIIEPTFVRSGLYPPMLARALDALRALAVRIDAEDAPFTRPEEGGTLREAYALISRMEEPANGMRIVRAIQYQTYGTTLARALFSALYYGADTDVHNQLMDETIPFVQDRINVEEVLYWLDSARRALDSIAEYGNEDEAPRVPLPPDQRVAALRRK